MLSTLPVFLGVIIPVTESFVHPLETAAKIKSTALIFLNTGISDRGFNISWAENGNGGKKKVK